MCDSFCLSTVLIVFQVWATVPPWKQGSLADFVTLTEFEVRYSIMYITNKPQGCVFVILSTDLLLTLI